MFDRVALVTGAGRGIGEASARALAQAGYCVALMARKPEEIQSVSQSINQSSGRSFWLTGDITSERDNDDIVERVLREFDRLDVLITCAASEPAVAPSETLKLSEWSRVIDTDLTGTFLTCRAAARAMMRNQYGRIINISSFHAVATYPQRAAYAAAKAGVCGLTRALALEWADRGVTVNAIAPGPIRTPRTSWFLSQDPSSEGAMKARTPRRRLGEPSDVAAAVLFLASEKADFITGQTIVVDGGWTVSAWWGQYGEARLP